jgi:hypothetical protein
MTREARHLAVPFNFKRRVTADGLHSFPLSYNPPAASSEDDETGQV